MSLTYRLDPIGKVFDGRGKSATLSADAFEFVKSTIAAFDLVQPDMMRRIKHRHTLLGWAFYMYED